MFCSGLKGINPHSSYEFHRFPFSYCRFMLLHELLGYIRVKSTDYRFRNMFFVLVPLNLRSTHLGFVEPEVEGSSVIVGLVSEMTC